MGCGCNHSSGPASVWVVQNADGTTKAFATAVGANAEASRTPGSIVIPPQS